MLCYYVYHSITPHIADEMLHRRVKQRIFQIYNEGLGLAASSDPAQPCTRQDVTARMSQKLSVVQFYQLERSVWGVGME